MFYFFVDDIKKNFKKNIHTLVFSFFHLLDNNANSEDKRNIKGCIFNFEPKIFF
jgi:hypothetical protein